ncbi:membrane protein insertase YidC [Sansalvadorimonas sp. 2012CJ34-2]|uniref:Membrane protein insertase YidC n=1 Tax=Parendozoicomonas callyspongiae TaxID=2942213 RepID=A0ABT0PB02_9GAMM|nr:membrane protein insertase YidC [Sansalvadorimonas sp. 2012CJ34-2]MCL6268562.1 membrane protein insertase YidC [Sansalvadorimonas sp. 2012CJ34-2]
MDLQRTLLIAGLVVVGYLTVLQWNQDYNQPPAVSQTEAQLPATSAPAVQSTSATSDAPDLAQDSLPDTNDSAPSAELVTVTTDTLIMTIDTRGGDIVRIELPKYPRVKGQTEPFVLLENTAHRTFIAQSGLTGANGPDRLGKPVYNSAKTSYSLGNSQELNVDLTLKADNGVNITKRFVFTKGTYQVKVDYRIQNNSDSTWRGNFYSQLKRDNTEDPSREISSSGNINTYLGAAVKTEEKHYEKLDFSDFTDSPFKEKVKGGYAAIVQHYFVTAWVPNQNQVNTFQTRVYKGDNIISVVEPTVEVAPGQTETVGATLYAGPKNQEVLESLAQGLDLTIDYGMLWWFAKPLFLLLSYIHSVLGNWGWSIITLTIIVKGLFFPLSKASYTSMAKMRKISPKMQALKEKHGEDKQALSQAMMKLYKDEKVNPMGGCLPILVQMPVFIALYWVLIESVELRHAPWLGWIHDLSQMDPYFILPLIMGASMFAQQLLSPTPPDPMQARVMKLMPVIFTFFFLWFPAGLVLYWVTNNLLSISQQWYITKSIEAQD